MTTLCLQLDDSYKTPNIFFYSESNSDSLNRPPNTNLNNVQGAPVGSIVPRLFHISGPGAMKAILTKSSHDMGERPSL